MCTNLYTSLSLITTISEYHSMLALSKKERRMRAFQRTDKLFYLESVGRMPNLSNLVIKVISSINTLLQLYRLTRSLVYTFKFEIPVVTGPS